ncbi:hypothetical protein TanjilG_11832 [Lupinus angustifolius]|uniref:UBA domain-containing protein n=1 Tax=Lupinus angustifolius TaxID=3871 RepID=A0A4P1R693_LUPAN|nr:hypothetical protein TanjilG_11832 [Lupinus angustifolius]
MNGGPSGFTNAPVTRAFIIASALFTIFFGIQGRFNTLGLSYQGEPRCNDKVVCLVTLEVMGSNPILETTSSLAKVRLCSSNPANPTKSEPRALDPTTKLVTPGPYGLIFASFIPFFFDIPVSTRFRVFSFHFSDKSFVYLAGLQLLLSSWRRSIIPGICGILAGALYRSNVFYIRKAKFPEFIASFFSRITLPSMGSPPAPSTRNVTGNRNYPAPMPSSVEPSEDSITTLVSMGFDRNSARQALVQARNDVNVATNILLEAQSH